MGILGNDPGSYNLINNKPGGGGGSGDTNNLLDWVAGEDYLQFSERVYDFKLYVSLIRINDGRTTVPSEDGEGWRQAGILSQVPDVPAATSSTVNYNLQRPAAVPEAGVTIKFNANPTTTGARTYIQGFPSAVTNLNAGTLIEFTNGSLAGRVTTQFSDGNVGPGIRINIENSSRNNTLTQKVAEFVSIINNDVRFNIEALVSSIDSEWIEIFYTDKEIDIVPTNITVKTQSDAGIPSNLPDDYSMTIPSEAPTKIVEAPLAVWSIDTGGGGGSSDLPSIPAKAVTDKTYILEVGKTADPEVPATAQSTTISFTEMSDNNFDIIDVQDNFNGLGNWFDGLTSTDDLATITRLRLGGTGSNTTISVQNNFRMLVGPGILTSGMSNENVSAAFVTRLNAIPLSGVGTLAIMGGDKTFNISRKYTATDNGDGTFTLTSNELGVSGYSYSIVFQNWGSGSGAALSNTEGTDLIPAGDGDPDSWNDFTDPTAAVNANTLKVTYPAADSTKLGTYPVASGNTDKFLKSDGSDWLPVDEPTSGPTEFIKQITKNGSTSITWKDQDNIVDTFTPAGGSSGSEDIPVFYRDITSATLLNSSGFTRFNGYGSGITDDNYSFNSGAVTVTTAARYRVDFNIYIPAQSNGGGVFSRWQISTGVGGSLAPFGTIRVADTSASFIDHHSLSGSYVGAFNANATIALFYTSDAGYTGVTGTFTVTKLIEGASGGGTTYDTSDLIKTLLLGPAFVKLSVGTEVAGVTPYTGSLAGEASTTYYFKSSDDSWYSDSAATNKIVGF